MQRHGACGGHIPLHHQHFDHFSRKAGEGGQGTEKPRDKCQSPHGVELRHGVKQRDDDADEVAPYPIGSQRAPGNEPAGAKPQAQPPTGECTQRRSDADGKNIQHRMIVAEKGGKALCCDPQ